MPTLVLQRGHVGRTSGATGTAGEQEMAKSVAARVIEAAPPGWTVRVIDADPSSDTAYRGNAFVAVHGDGNNNRAVNGASVGYQTPEGKSFASAWKTAYGKVGWKGAWHSDNYTANLGGYYGVRKAKNQGNRKAIVIEVGTMTNAKDRAWIDAHHADIAASIWMALVGQPTDRYAVVGCDRLNVRATPPVNGRLGKRYGSYKRGWHVKVLERRGEWWRVRRLLLAGWVNSKYLAPV